MSFSVSSVGLTTFLCLMKYYLASDSALHSAQGISVLVPSWTTEQGNDFYPRNLTPLLHFNKKDMLFIAEDFRNIYFLQHFYQFSQWMRCEIFQINTDILTNQQSINIFTQEALQFSFILIKKLALSIANVFGNIHFLQHLHYF